MNKEALLNIGLSNNETEIYLALLRNGPCLVSKIVDKTGINRTNIYDRLERLIDKGLVSYVIKNNRKNFVAAKPEIIFRYLEEKRSRINQEEKDIRDILPELNRIRPNTADECVEVYEGKEGLKTILEEVIREKKDILTYGSDGNFSRILRYCFKHYLRRLEKEGIRMKVIFDEENKRDFRWKNAKVKYIPKEFKSPTETTIYGNKVIIFILTEEPKAIVITSKSISAAYRNYFKILWKSAKEAI